MATTERFHTLTSPWLDGMMKARYDTYDAELILVYAGTKAVLEETDCDALLRVIETAFGEDQAIADITEFIEEVCKVKLADARRMALWFVENAVPIAKEVYT